MKTASKKLIVFMVLSFPAILLGLIVRILAMGYDFGKRMSTMLLK